MKEGRKVGRKEEGKKELKYERTCVHTYVKPNARLIEQLILLPNISVRQN